MINIETDTGALFTRHPHLRSIELLWGSTECRKVLTGLLFDNRDGKRQGFDPAASKTIFALLNEHDKRFPQFA